MTAETDLKLFIRESVKRAEAKGYYSPLFNEMCIKWGDVEAIKRLVESGDIQVGFLKMKSFDLLDWTMEAAVLKFPSLFNERTHEAAK